MRARFPRLLLLLAALPSATLPLAVSAQERGDPTVVLVHGAWGGGWDWRTVEDELRARGADVYRVTLTGLGARHHLASPDVGLDTHVADVVNVILWEGLENVILVGHSYGGMVITGVAEAVPQRLRHIVYVDAFVPFDGECVMSARGGGECGAVDAVEGQVDGLLAPRWVEPGTQPPSDVPHPAKTFVDPVRLEGLPAHGRPASYILTRSAEGEPDGFDWAAERAREMGWPVTEVIAGHNLQRDDPVWLAEFLVGLG